MAEQPPPDEHPTTDAAADAEIARFDRVSNGLKRGFEALGAADLSDEAKASWHTRLIAITNSSKHDLATAEGRLDRYWTEWEQQVGPRPTT